MKTPHGVTITACTNVSAIRIAENDSAEWVEGAGDVQHQMLALGEGLEGKPRS